MTDTPKTYVSFEHRLCDEVAEKIMAAVIKRWSAVWATMAEFADVDAMMNARTGFVVGVERFKEIVAIGPIGDAEYSLQVERSDKWAESRINKHDDPEQMYIVPVTVFEAKIEPTSLDDRFKKPTTSVTLSHHVYGDETITEVPLEITATVPVVHSSQKIEMGIMSVTFHRVDDGSFNHHILDLKQIAVSKDPDLGDYAVRGIREVLEATLTALQ